MALGVAAREVSHDSAVDVSPALRDHNSGGGCRHVIADLGTSGVPAPVAVTCGASGHRAAVCSERTGEYAVFARPQGGGSWPRCDAGRAVQVAWHSEADVVALLVAGEGRTDARAAAKAAASLIKPKVCPLSHPAGPHIPCAAGLPRRLHSVLRSAVTRLS